MDFIIETAKVAIAFIIITDAIGNLPFFMGMTEGMTLQERRSIFGTATPTRRTYLA